MIGSKSQTEQFTLEGFIARIRAAASASATSSASAAASAEAAVSTAVHAIMRSTFADHQDIAAALPRYDDDDVVLYEDASVSIWFCRFQPGLVVPAHDHQMRAFIGVFAGVEDNSFYSAEKDGLRKVHEKQVGAGDVISIDPSAIHSVSCPGPQPSCALHVYLGRLTKVERSLFLWDSGEKIPFTEQNYQRLISEG